MERILRKGLSRRHGLIWLISTLISSCTPPGHTTITGSNSNPETEGKPEKTSPSTLCVNFEAQINGDSASALMTTLLDAIAAGTKDLRLFVASSGGDVADAVQLYNFITTLPVDLSTYNTSQVNSAAVIVYLAANKRFAVKNSFFQLHAPFVKPQDSNRNWRREYEMAAGDQMENIIRERTKLSDDQLSTWRRHKSEILSADAAYDAGIVTKVIPSVIIPAGSILTSIHNADN